MCIDRAIGRSLENLFPFDRRLTSCVATSAAIVAVVSTILLSLAIYMQWGLAALIGLSITSGIAALITLAIVCCRETSLDRGSQRRNLPLPSEIDAPPNFVAQLVDNDRTYERAGKELYSLVKKGDIDGYSRALAAYNHEELDNLCFNFQTIYVDPDDSTNTLAACETQKNANNLFQIVLMLKDSRVKILFLRATFEKLKDHSAFEHQGIYINELLKIEDLKLIELILKKLSQEAIQIVVKTALDPEKENKSIWVSAFFALYKTDPEVEASFDKNDLMEALVKSRLGAGDKIGRLDYFAKQAGTTLERMEIPRWFNLRKQGRRCAAVTGSVLHLAIDAQNNELVKIFARDSLINKPAVVFSDCHLSPLMQAVMIGNVETVNILLAAKPTKPNLNFLLKNPRNYMEGFPEHRNGCTQITPLMIAARLGRKEIYDALIAAGADPLITDNPTDNPKDPKAWRAEDYAKAFKAAAK